MKTSEFKTRFQNNEIQEWTKKLLKEIKIEEYEQTVHFDRNGIEIHPIYVNTIEKPTTISRNNSEWWIVNPYFIHKNEKEINQKILHDLNEGVSGIQLIIEHENVDIPTLLSGIDTKAIMLHFSTNENNHAILAELENYFTERGQENMGNMHIDSMNPYYIFQNQICINGTMYNNAGANTITELSALLSQLNLAFHECQENNSLKDIQSISISLSVDTNYFEQIAKLRALRTLIESIQSAYSIEIPVYLHVSSSKIYLTQKDYNNNFIRNTLAGMAAIIGSADSLCIFPHDFYIKENPSLSDNRLSKNQQLLFKEESNLASVMNAADGSYFIENYTEKLIEKAYLKFQNLEESGGWMEAKEYIVQEIHSDKKYLIQSYNEKKKTLIGINKYPNTTETIQQKKITNDFWQGIQSMNIESEMSS